MPAHPWTLGAYITACERRFPKGAMPDRIGAIAKAHVLQGFPPPDRHPTVTGALDAIETRLQMRGIGSDLFPSDVTALDAESTNDTEQPEPAKEARALRQTPLLVSRRPPKA